MIPPNSGHLSTADNSFGLTGVRCVEDPLYMALRKLFRNRRDFFLLIVNFIITVHKFLNIVNRVSIV